MTFTPDHPKVRTCLWFSAQAEDAALAYVALLPESRITGASRPRPDQPPLVVELQLCGTPYMFLNGGPTHRLSPAASIAVRTETQEETDRLWAELTRDGGEEGRCDWLVDRFGVSWQLVPEALPRLLGSSDREAADRAFQAMFEMKKIDIAALEAAFRGA